MTTNTSTQSTGHFLSTDSLPFSLTDLDPERFVSLSAEDEDAAILDGKFSEAQGFDFDALVADEAWMRENSF